jgi:hypothetical protein
MSRANLYGELVMRLALGKRMVRAPATQGPIVTRRLGQDLGAIAMLDYKAQRVCC